MGANESFTFCAMCNLMKALRYVQCELMKALRFVQCELIKALRSVQCDELRLHMRQLHTRNTNLKIKPFIIPEKF